MPGSHHTHRWIRFGSFFTLQPSEIAKPVLVLFLAWFLHTRLGAMRDWKHTLLPAAIIPGLFIVLIAAQPDLGTALVLMPMLVVGAFLAGLQWKHAAVIALIGLLMLPIGIHFLKPYQKERITSFLHPEGDPKGAGYQLLQSFPDCLSC